MSANRLMFNFQNFQDVSVEYVRHFNVTIEKLVQLQSNDRPHARRNRVNIWN